MKKSSKENPSTYKRLALAGLAFVIGFFISIAVLLLFFTLSSFSMLGLYGVVGACVFAVLTFSFPRFMGGLLFFLTVFQ